MQAHVFVSGIKYVYMCILYIGTVLGRQTFSKMRNSCKAKICYTLTHTHAYMNVVYIAQHTHVVVIHNRCENGKFALTVKYLEVGTNLSAPPPAPPL